MINNMKSNTKANPFMAAGFKNACSSVALTLSTTLLMGVCATSLLACSESQSTPAADHSPALTEQKAISMTQKHLQNDTWQQTVAQTFHIPTPPLPFDPNRSAEYLLANCAAWAEPISADEYANNWYRAATHMQATRGKTPGEYQKMLSLYEAAARRGHYKAIKQLTILYTSGGFTLQASFLPEPAKARYWINHGLDKGWLGALEWAAWALGSGAANFPGNAELGRAYMQQAADMGVPLAQFQLALYYGNRLKQVDKEKALLQCAAAQGLHTALYDWGGYNEIHQNSEVALPLYQRAIMAGGQAGGEAAYTLHSAFSTVGGHSKIYLQTPDDEKRAAAYQELKRALTGGGGGQDGNMFLSFPRLNEVLPLPPAPMPEWKGIYSAMSEDDAKYYQNPPPPDFYIEQARKMGYMVKPEYLSQPTPHEK